MSDTGMMLVQETVMFLGLVFLVAWVLFLIFHRYKIRVHESVKRLDMFGKLVDKFGDSKEFVGFVQSDEGRRLLRDSGVNGVSARKIALRMFIVAALLFAVGYGFLSGTSAYDNFTDPNFVNKVADMRYWGRLSFGLAVGFVGAGILTTLFGDDSKKGSNT